MAESTTENVCKSSEKEAAEQEKGKNEQMRPTHFIAIRLASDEKIRKGARLIQELLIQQNPILQLSLTSVSKLHFTLMVLSAPDVETKQGMVSAFEKLTLNQEELPKISLNDFGTFNAKVGFLKPKENDQKLNELAMKVRSHMHTNGFGSDSNFPFIPHATVFKSSKVKKKAKKEVESILSGLFLGKPGNTKEEPSFRGETENFRTRLNGILREMDGVPPQQVFRLELCSMVDPPAGDGFYTVLALSEPKR